VKKISRYNHIYTWRDGYNIAYNARSGGLALLTPENIDVLKSLFAKLKKNEENTLSKEEAELLEQLSHGSFVYEDQRDEIDILRFQHMADKYDRTELGLTIAPTMACNMACAYCYEANKKGLINDEIIRALYDMVEKQGQHLDKLAVTWFGGEPLLALDKIEEISGELISMGRKHNYKFSAQIISNGYLLTPETADRLTELKIGHVQVTLDGPSRLHNRKRPLKNGSDSYKIILDNIKHASSKMSVAVRVNVDMSFTAELISEMLDELTAADLKHRVGIYFGMVEPVSEVCGNIAENCFNNHDFSKLEIEFYSLLLDRDFSINYVPRPCASYCMAQTLNSFIVDPAGNLYRCLGYIGDPEKSMGNIAEEIDYGHPNFTRLFDLDPFDNDSCRECNVLPLCMGGCPSRRADRNMENDDLCGTWKHQLPAMLDIIARSRQAKIKSNV